jgi:hypothetical protein
LQLDLDFRVDMRIRGFPGRRAMSMLRDSLPRSASDDQRRERQHPDLHVISPD